MSHNKIILVNDVTSLLRLWSCHINHNISATQTQPYGTDRQTDRLTNTLALRGLEKHWGGYDTFLSTDIRFWRDFFII